MYSTIVKDSFEQGYCINNCTTTHRLLNILLVYIFLMWISQTWLIGVWGWLFGNLESKVNISAYIKCLGLMVWEASWCPRLFGKQSEDFSLYLVIGIGCLRSNARIS